MNTHYIWVARLLLTFNLVMIATSVAFCQHETIRLLQLNSSGFQRVDVLLRRTSVREPTDGVPFSSETVMRLSIDGSKEMAVMLAVTRLSGTRQYYASRCHGRKVEIRAWPNPLTANTLESFDDCLSSASVPILDFVGTSKFPMDAGLLSSNMLKSKAGIWDGILTTWSGSARIFSDGSITRFQSTPHPVFHNASELTISNESGLPMQYSSLRIDPNDPNNRNRLFIEEYEWTRKNNVDVPIRISQEGKVVLADSTGKKVAKIASTEWEFKWIKVNQDLDPFAFSDEIFTDPNVVIRHTDFDKIEGM